MVLNKIFNQKNVVKIIPCFYETSKNYLSCNKRIKRIIDNENNESRVASFPKSLRIPQHDDNETQKQEFDESLNKLFGAQGNKLNLLM